MNPRLLPLTLCENVELNTATFHGVMRVWRNVERKSRLNV